MAKLSQVMNKDVRKVVPFFVQDNEGKLNEDKIIIKNPTKVQMEDLKTLYEEKENSDDITDEDIFFKMIEMFTDLDVDLNRDEFFECMQYFSDVIEAIKLEFDGILYEIIISGYEKIDQLLSMPEDKRIKILATNPELKAIYLETLSQKENLEHDNEDELKKEREKAEKEKKKAELLAQSEELAAQLKELED